MTKSKFTAFVGGKCVHGEVTLCMDPERAAFSDRIDLIETETGSLVGVLKINGTIATIPFDPPAWQDEAP